MGSVEMSFPGGSFGAFKVRGSYVISWRAGLFMGRREELGGWKVRFIKPSWMALSLFWQTRSPEWVPPEQRHGQEGEVVGRELPSSTKNARRGKGSREASLADWEGKPLKGETPRVLEA